MNQDKPITMDDIARLANVSKPTVSRALNDSPLVNPETKQQVLEVARKHGYAVNRNAQKLRHKRTHTVAVSVDFQVYRENHISDPFILELLAGVSEALGDNDQDLLLCSHSHNSIDALRELINSRTADGIIFLGQGHREVMLNTLADLGTPIVMWGASDTNAKYCVVGSDNYLGGKLAGEYLLKKQRHSILYLGDTSHLELRRRYEGLTDAVSESSLDADVAQITPDELSFESAFDACYQYLTSTNSVPDGIFACSDTAAMAAIRALTDLNYKVPDEVSVIGYNDILTAAHFTPPITTIRQDTKLAGTMLVNKLMEILNGEQPDSTNIETHIIPRLT